MAYTREQLESGLAKAKAKGDQEAVAHIESLMKADGIKNTAVNVAGSAVEPIASLASGMVATPIAGLAGLAAPLVGADPKETVEKVQGGLTYEPRTEGGRIATEAVTYPFRKLAEGADVAGGAVTDVTGSPALGATVNTAIQAAPAVVLGVRGRAKQAGRNPTQVAEAYVRSSTGLDWNALAPAFKQKLVDIATKSGDLSGLNPAAVERQGRLQSMDVPVPATRGQITRDSVALRTEGNVAATEAGKPVRDVHVSQNKALLENLEVLKTPFQGGATTPEAVGQSVQGAARSKLAAKKAEVRQLYKDAESSPEANSMVSSMNPLFDVMKQADPKNFGFIMSWAKRNKLITQNAQGRPAMQMPTVKQLSELRKEASVASKEQSTAGHWAGQAKSAIDQIVEGAAGDKYNKAITARRQQGQEFQDRQGVKQLVTDRGGDRAVALEDTWRKTVVGGSIEDLRFTIKSLTTEGTPQTRAAGAQAVKDLQHQTLQHIIDQSTKGVARFEDGTPNITPAALKQAVESVGYPKLEILYGPKVVAKIKNVVRAASDLKTEPPTSFKGSSTVANLLNFMERSIGQIPLVGSASDVVAGTVRAGMKLHEIGKGGRQAREALSTPLDEAAAAGKPFTKTVAPYALSSLNQRKE